MTAFNDVNPLTIITAAAIALPLSNPQPSVATLPVVIIEVVPSVEPSADEDDFSLSKEEIIFNFIDSNEFEILWKCMDEIKTKNKYNYSKAKKAGKG